MREQGSGSRRVVELALENSGFKLKSFKNVMNLDSTEAIKSAVEVGLGSRVRFALGDLQGSGTRSSENCRGRGLKVDRHFSLVSRTGPDPKAPPARLHVFARACASSVQPRSKAL